MKKINNAQLIANVEKQFLEKKKKRSINHIKYSARLLYRSSSNRKCTIGVSIPAKLYNKNIEDKSIIFLLLHDTNIKKYFSQCSIWLLVWLQHIHDDNSYWTINDYPNNSFRDTVYKMKACLNLLDKNSTHA